MQVFPGTLVGELHRAGFLQDSACSTPPPLGGLLKGQRQRRSLKLSQVLVCRWGLRGCTFVPVWEGLLRTPGWEVTGRVVRPLILAQALTCNTFLWGLSRLCLSNSPWDLSQDCPSTPSPRSMELRGSICGPSINRKSLRKGKAGQTQGVGCQPRGVYT